MNVSFPREGDVSSKFEVSTGYRSALMSPNGTDRQTDRQTPLLRNTAPSGTAV